MQDYSETNIQTSPMRFRFVLMGFQFHEHPLSWSLAHWCHVWVSIHKSFCADGLILHGLYWVCACVALTTGVCLTLNPAWNVKINQAKKY